MDHRDSFRTTRNVPYLHRYHHGKNDCEWEKEEEILGGHLESVPWKILGLQLRRIGAGVRLGYPPAPVRYYPMFLPRRREHFRQNLSPNQSRECHPKQRISIFSFPIWLAFEGCSQSRVLAAVHES